MEAESGWKLRRNARPPDGGRRRGMPFAEHIVATTRGRGRSLLEPQLAGWLWVHMAAALPDALSFVLMTDHFHLMALPGRVERVRRVLGGLTRAFGIRMEVEAAERASTPKILGRQVRYGFYNPVRAGLVDNPWQWPWSTLRDLGGACYPIWTPLASVAAALRLSPESALRGLSHLGAHQPQVPRAVPLEVASSHDLLHAVGGVLRLPIDDLPRQRVGRRLIVQAAASVQQPLRGSHLAGVLQISDRAVRRLRAPIHPGLGAALVCLSNSTLRRPM